MTFQTSSITTIDRNRHIIRYTVEPRLTVACSRCSDTRAREKNSRRKIKKGERLEGERGRERSLALVPPRPHRFPGVQFNSLPTDRHALLFERLEHYRLALRTPCDYCHFFWRSGHPAKRTIHFLVKKPSLIRSRRYYGQIFWPIGDCINGVLR